MYNTTVKQSSSLQVGILALFRTLLFSISVASIPPAFALTGYVAQNQPVGYIGQERTSNATLASGTETLYRSEYQKTDWSGNLFAYPISADANVNIGAERWGGSGAAAVIDTQNFSTGRNIATMKDDGTAVPFLAGSLSAAQVTSLTGSPFTGAQIINYLRGDRSNEAVAAMRMRNTVLGDIIHSRPLYIADATNPTVLVGANDGMMHAINAADGSERWGYVPSMLLSKMKNLTAAPYIHDYYVDGQFTVGTVNIAGNKRVLVGALGSGGKGLYALNITDLTAATDSNVASKVLWEITPSTLNYATPQIYPSTTSATAYQNLGYTHGIPQITKINNGGTLQDAVIVANGINTCGTVGGTSPAGCDYQAYLFVIDAATGKLIRAILADTASTTDGTATSPNGLFNPLTIDVDGNGSVDKVYAGDLNGTLWKFDLSSTSPASWSVSALHTTSPAQPITATIDATTHPLGGYMVTFATGSELTGTYGTYNPATATWTTPSTGDLADTSVHYVYGIWDGAPAANTTLVTQILQNRDFIYPPPPATGGVTTKVRRVSGNAPNWASGGNKGWKLPLQICGLAGQPTCAGLGITAGGERVIGEGSFISSGRYYITVHNPTVPYLVPGTSTILMGENWQLSLYFANGGAHELFMDLNASGLVGNDDRIQYIATDANVLSGANLVGDAITLPDEDGIAVGKLLSRGVSSQPVLVKLTSLYTTLFSENPDVSVPVTPDVEQGVTGGHFDTDIFYGSTSGGTKATATITVGTTGQSSGYPAALGGISVDGTIISPALPTSLLANGTATTTNANAIRTEINNLTASGYTATVSGNQITITAPLTGDLYNGKTFTITPGSSATLVDAKLAVSAAKASQAITFTNPAAINPTGMSILLNGTEILTATTPGSAKTSAQLATWVAANVSAAFLTNYDIAASGSTVTITAKTAVTSTRDITTLTASAATASASTIVGSPSYVSGATAVTGVRPTGLITFGPATGLTSSTTSATINKTLSSNSASIIVGTNKYTTAISIGKSKTPANAASTVQGKAIPNTTSYIGGNTITPTCAAQTASVVCLVDTSSYTNGTSVQIGTTSNMGTVTVATTNTAGAQAPAAAVQAAGSFTFTNSVPMNPTGFAVAVNGTNMMSASSPGSNMTSAELAGWVAASSAKTGYTISASGSTVTIRSNTADTTHDITSLAISGNVPVLTRTIGTAIAGVTAAPAVAQSGWTNFAPALTSTAFSGGVNSTVTGDTCTSSCSQKKHIHQYDDKFDVTGLNMLNASESGQNLSIAIPSSGTSFKVLMHNQYLSPAAKLHIGDASYRYNVNFGYVSVKDYQTAATLDLATVPTYNMSTIGSLAINLPTDALTAKNWWGNGDVRSGLHPTNVSCVWASDSANDGNMYFPVIPPVNGVEGHGTNGWSTTTTPATATGARHNGALVVQIIKSTTPNADIEQNVAGRPEYGWRVKSAKYSTDVLAEYAMYWHFGPCYGDTTTTQKFEYNFNFGGSLDLSSFSFKVDGIEILTSNNPPLKDKSTLVTWIMANKSTPAGYTITSSGSTVYISKSDNSLPEINVSATNLPKDSARHTYTKWTKSPVADSSGCAPLGTNTYCTAPATGSTDPHIGDLSSGVTGDVTSVVSNTVGNVTTTTITYADGTTATIVTTVNTDGTVTVVTTDKTGAVTTVVSADTRGGSGTSGLLSGSTSGVGRISWRELIKK